MKTYRRRKKPIVMQLVQAGLAWTLLGIAAAGVILSHQGMGALAADRAMGPTAEAIERAVLEAEAQANVTQARTTSSELDAPSGKFFGSSAG